MNLERWASPADQVPEIERALSTGAFGAVYRARSAEGTACVLKVLHRRYRDNVNIRARFDQEAEALRSLAGEAVPRLLAAGETEEGAPYLAIELLPGTSALHESEARRGIPYAEVHDILLRVLNVLSAAHERGLLHRRLSPQSVVRTPLKQTCVLDFGVALDLCAVTDSRPDMPLGQAAYLAPEQLIGAHACVGPHTDIFSLAASAVRLLAGRKVRSVDFGSARPFPDVHRLGLEAPREWLDLLAKATRFDPAERYASADDMRAALQGLPTIARAHEATEAVRELWRSHLAAAKAREAGARAMQTKVSSRAVVGMSREEAALLSEQVRVVRAAMGPPRAEPVVPSVAPRPRCRLAALFSFAVSARTSKAPSRAR